MSDWPDLYARTGIGGQLSAGGVTPFADVTDISNIGYASTAGVWTANRAVYQPVVLSDGATIDRFAVTVSTTGGNLDVGLYDWNNNRLVSSGSVATAAAGVQVIDVANTYVPPGWYKIGFSSNSAAAIFRNSTNSAVIWRACGLQEQATAFPLPNPAVPVGLSTAMVPLVVASYRAIV